MMPEAGQPIDPGLIQALGSISNAPEEQDRIALQMKLAQQLRNSGQPPQETQMAGRVAVRNSPLQYASGILHDYLGMKQQMDAMSQQKALSRQLRDVRGRYMDAVTAQQNPDKIHPSSFENPVGAMDPLGGSAEQPWMTAGYDAQPGESPL